MKSIRREHVIAALFVLLVAGYLSYLNYRIPFLTMDELAFMGKMQGGIESRLIYGRPSHVIGYGINNFIGFATPDFVGLTKRLITMLVLFSSIVATLIHFEIPRLRAVGLASFAVMAHQVDWQHNGLVAFFGGYNLFLGFFLWALILNERAQVTARIYILVFLLIFLSFTSELFVILTLIYIAIKALQVKNSSPFYKGPIASATFVYLFLFIILRAIYEDPTRIGGVSSLTYAMGSVSKFSPTDIVAGTLISFINSVPYFSSLELPNIVEICVASILAGSLIVFSIRTFYLNRHLSVANLDILGNVRSVAFLITLCALALIPSLLMALQPMKLEWILSGSSRRYAFSLYEWLAFVMLSSIFIKHSPLGKSIAVLVGLSVIATVMLLNSVFNNLKFTDSYADSLNNWRSLNKAILRSEGNPPRN